MIALLRYAAIKGWREKSLQPIILAPVVLVGSPILMMMLYDSYRGRQAWPFRLPGLTPERSAFLFLGIATVTSAVGAGAAAFSAFRTEIANRSIGFMILATRSWTVVLAATLYGIAAGLLAFSFSVVSATAMTGSVPADLTRTGAAAVALTFLTAAMGAALGAWSSDYGMMLPVIFATLFLAGAIEQPLVLLTLSLFAAAAVAVLIGALLLERKCTA